MTGYAAHIVQHNSTCVCNNSIPEYARLSLADLGDSQYSWLVHLLCNARWQLLIGLVVLHSCYVYWCCSFNSTELANRLVPVQPTEMEARARAALLMDTIAARLRTDSSSSSMDGAAGSSPPAALQVSGKV